MPLALRRCVNRALATLRSANLRTVLRHLGVIAIFTIPSIVIFWHAWSGHLSSTATCACSDAGQQIWFIAWPAYAIAHATNPFFSSVVWAPHGSNLLDNASGPLIGILFAPLTWIWGPVASTNIALTLAPGLSAWACWIACRRFVGWKWAAWVGGLLFGYSPFVISSIRQGHLGLGLLVIPPLMLVMMDEILSKQRISPLISGLMLGLLAVAQFFISPEVLIITSLIAVLATFVACAIAGRSWFRLHLKYVVQSIGTALTTAAVLLVAPVWFALAGPGHIVGAVFPGQNLFGNNFNDLWASNISAWVGAVAFGPVGHSAANLGFTGPNSAYLGIGALALAGLSIALSWRRRACWALLAAAMGSFVLSLGSAGLRDDALRSLSWLPWQTLVKWPLLEDVAPSRFSLCTDLCLAVLVAIGLDECRKRFFGSGNLKAGNRRKQIVSVVGVCVVAAALFVPTWGSYSLPTATESVRPPPWFATAALRVPAGSVVLTYPFPASASLASEPMIWQAVDDMHFRLAGGYVKVPGPDGRVLQAGSPGSATSSLTLLTLVRQSPTQSWAPSSTELGALRHALSDWEVDYIVITDTGMSPTYTAAVLTAASGRMPQVEHRAWVWDLRHAPLEAKFDADAASSAFAECRSVADLYRIVQSNAPLSQKANVCVSRHYDRLRTIAK